MKKLLLLCTASVIALWSMAVGVTSENDKPVKVPKLILQTDDEHLAWSHGEERRRIRIQRKKDKLDGI